MPRPPRRRAKRGAIEPSWDEPPSTDVGGGAHRVDRVNQAGNDPSLPALLGRVNCFLHTARPRPAGRTQANRGAGRSPQWLASIMCAMVKNSSVKPVLAPWLKYQPASPGYLELGSAARVAWLSCMSTMLILCRNGMS